MKASHLALPLSILVIVAALSQARLESAITSEPAGKPEGPKPPGRVGMVAGEFRAKGEPKDLAAGVIAFNGPNGNGRSGSRGIFLQNTQTTGQQGSNWSFRYSRDGTAYGVQIVHPHGKGQVIVHVHKDHIGISAPKFWTEVGWSGGSDKLVKKTAAFAKMFPLIDGQPTTIESRLSPNGSYEIAVQGLVVATAHIPSATSPLSINIPEDKRFPNCGRTHSVFSGGGLPMEWLAGNAAVILSPLDGGVNIVRDASFRPSPK